MIKISEYFSLLLLMISKQMGMHFVQIIIKFLLNVNLTYMELVVSCPTLHRWLCQWSGHRYNNLTSPPSLAFLMLKGNQMTGGAFSDFKGSDDSIAAKLFTWNEALPSH